MVLFVVVIVGAIIFSLIFFTPVGELLVDNLPSPGISTPLYNESPDTLGIESGIAEGIEGASDLAVTMAGETDIESLGLPNNPTNKELANVIDSTFNIGKSTLNLYFALKAWIEDGFNLVSPVSVPIVLVGVIGAILAIVLIIGIAKHTFKHAIWFLVILVGIVIVFITFGSEINF